MEPWLGRLTGRANEERGYGDRATTEITSIKPIMESMDIDDYVTPEAERLLRSAQERYSDGAPARRTLITEAFGAAVFLVGAGLLAVLSAWTQSLSIAALAVTVVAYLLAARVRFPVGSAWTAPTQLVFVPMLFVLPMPLVPVIVAACSVLDLWPQALQRRLSLTRICARVGDSFYSLGPALVLVLGGHQHFSWTHWPLFLLAFGAQVVCDATAGLARTWFAERIRPSAQLPMVWLYLTDAALSCVGLLTAAPAVSRPGLVLLELPLIGLLSLFARERQQRLKHTLALGTAYRGTALILGDVIDTIDDYTGIHSREVGDLSLALAGVLQLDAVRRRNVELAALLHDVGKIRIPKEIINKPDKLNVLEWEIMRRHTTEGETMLRQVGGALSCVGGFVRSSHERYDGQGYPDGLAGEAIPIESRIICVCDAYNAMTTDRPYRAARAGSEALVELRDCAGTQFDPRLVGAITDLLSARLLTLESPTIIRKSVVAKRTSSLGDDLPAVAGDWEDGLRGAAKVRDEAAVMRDEDAIDRDLAAGERDRLAGLRDEQARHVDRGSLPPRQQGEYAALDREHAARDRERAARDRERAARDREQAIRDRDAASRDLLALTTDDLTKTRRRGPGLSELQREIDRARRTNQPLTVAYVDVDGLKAINDTDGHTAGDDLLVGITDALRSDLRSYDSIVRLGGDEFLCVLPGVGIDAARAALHHVRDWILESTEHGSISIGFAQLESEETRESLIARADRNLMTNRHQVPRPRH